MTDTAENDQSSETPKKGKKGLLFGLIGAMMLGGGGFYATYSGMILGPATGSDHAAADDGHGGGHGEETGHATANADIGYVEIDPLVVSLGKYATSRYLRFHAYIEVEPDAVEEVSFLKPRILDVLNTYLRAISEADMEDPTAMNDLRAQMLRRIQAVAGRENVRDLLIAEFVLN